ncbi:helix-turn-helix domain-containing protein [Haloarchaeobius sp. HRN-SO-5]|uniref:helix-turn-helix domain-containing protein n=1 Tax=Haloarchaeobius sp. HRN-SO-5 TaxID=3446118 RepID=UPI003EBC783C
MVVYAEFEIPARGFRIGRAFSTLPDVRVEVDRIVPMANSVMPFIWVQGADPDEVIPATQAEGAVEHIEVLDTQEGAGSLYRVVWNRRFRDVVVEIADADIAALSVEGTAERWWFEFRAASREPLAELHEHLEDMGVPTTLVRIHDVDSRPRTERLTSSQLEAVQLAYDRGYFNEPRDVKLETLAEAVGISRQAFAGRLRRGLRTLVSTTVLESGSE